MIKVAAGVLIRPAYVARRLAAPFDTPTPDYVDGPHPRRLFLELDE